LRLDPVRIKTLGAAADPVSRVSHAMGACGSLPRKHCQKVRNDINGIYLNTWCAKKSGLRHRIELDVADQHKASVPERQLWREVIAN